MLKIFNYIMLPAMLLITICNACKDDTPKGQPGNLCNPDGNCNNGYVCDNGTCNCPEDALIFNNHCLVSEGAPYIFIGHSDCYCYDTLSLGFSGSGENWTVYMPFKVGGNVGSAQTGAQYFPGENDIDSFYVRQLPIRCFLPGDEPAFPEAFGKMLTPTDLQMRLVFRNAFTYEVIEECTMMMKRVR